MGHVSGVNYNTIGNAGTEFLEKFAVDDAGVAVKTTVNPMGFDRTKPNNLDENFVKQQMRIVKSFEELGTTPSFTCVPYEIFDIPQTGTPVSFAESNAADILKFSVRVINKQRKFIECTCEFGDRQSTLFRFANGRI